MPLLATRALSTASALGAFGAFRRYRVAINITISSNQTNYVLNTAKASGYVAGASDITLTINSGIYVSSNTTGGPALDVDASWAAGDTVSIANAGGFIVGCAGNGGAGAPVINAQPYAGSPGAAGGLALRAQRPITFNNTGGTIAGGGGGGGGGASAVNGSGYSGGAINACTGGGGGGGRSSAAANSSGGARGGVSGTPNDNVAYGTAGGTGTVSSQGGGGSGATLNVSGFTATSGGGGSGGAWGSAGSAGGSSNSARSGGGGGSGGAAVSGNANITWVATGTRLGAIA